MKTKSKRILSLLTALALLGAMLVIGTLRTSAAEYTDVDGITWSFTVNPDGNTATINTGETGGRAEVNVPGTVEDDSTHESYLVTALDSPGFSNNTNIKNLSLPEGLKTIAQSALNGMSVEELTLPSTLESLGSMQYFSMRSCQSITVRAGVGSGNYASQDGVLFSKDMKTLVKFPGGYVPADRDTDCIAIYYKGDLYKFSPLSSAPAQAEAEFGPDWKRLMVGYTDPSTQDNLGFSGTYTIPEGVETIGSYAFNGGSANLVLPETLKSIESRAFSSIINFCMPLEIPAGVQNISLSAFTDLGILQLPAIKVNPANAYYCDVDGVLFSKDMTTLIKCPNKYLVCRDEYSYTVPDSVTTIASTGLYMQVCRELTIPGTVTSLPSSAFNFFSIRTTVIYCDKDSVAHVLAQQNDLLFILRGEPGWSGPHFDGDYKYFVQDGKAVLYQNKKAMFTYGDTLEIPATLGGYPLETIFVYAFDDDVSAYTVQTRKLIIPEGVKCIRGMAFRNLGFTVDRSCDVYLPDSIERLDNFWLDSSFKGMVYCNTDTYAHQWLSDNSYPHTLLDLPEGEEDGCYDTPHEDVEKSLEPSEYYSFANKSANFTVGIGEYFIKNEDFLTLRDSIKALYKEPASYALLNSLQNARYRNWGGSCYGMSVTALLNKTGQLNFMANFAPGAPSLSAVEIPTENPAVESAINYYHFTQTIPYVRSDYYGSYCGGTNLPEGLEEAVQNAQSGKRMLFSYFSLGGGHTVVVHGYKAGAWGSHDLIAWDNRYPERDVVINISKNFQRCVVNGKEYVYGVEFATNFSYFDKFDITQPAISAPATEEFDGATLGVTPTADFTIAGAGGESLAFDNGTGQFTGDLDADFHFTVNSTIDGEPAPATLLFDVAGGEAFTFASEGALDVSLLGENLFAAAKSEAANAITIDPDAGILVQGSGAVDFEASIGVNNAVMDMVKASGTAVDEAKISLYGGGVLVEAETGDVNLFVISNTVVTQEIMVPNDYGNLLVTGDGGGGVTVLTSSENDGDFDIDLLHEHEHDYAAVTTLPTCTEQGFTTYTCACGDSYVDGYVAALGHDWGAWEVTTPATETTEGIETRVCKRSGCTQSETRPTGTVSHTHDYVGVVTPPTCTEQGYTTYTCAADGASYVGDQVAALGHDWGAWTITTSATTEHDGVETRVCVRDGCDQAETRTIPKLTQSTTLKWWEKLPSWLQWLLRIFLFGWIWM